MPQHTSAGSGGVSIARVKCRVLLDFDGTISETDTTDLLLERFADPAWHEIEEEWKAGRIGSRECMVRQIDLVRATPAEMDAFIGAIRIDPGFTGFAGCCGASGTIWSWSPTASTGPSAPCSIVRTSTFRISPITSSGAAATAGG